MKIASTVRGLTEERQLGEGGRWLRTRSFQAGDDGCWVVVYNTIKAENQVKMNEYIKIPEFRGAA